jgi:hypothetical protein
VTSLEDFFDYVGKLFVISVTLKSLFVTILT